MDISKYKQKILDEVNGANSKKIDTNTHKVIEAAHDVEKIEELIAVLTDDNASEKDKKEALNVLNILSVFSPQLSTKMPLLVNALRGLMDSKDHVIREQTFSSLTAMKDEIAQERLLRDLQSSEKKKEWLVKPHAAIAMLGHDEKTLTTSVLKNLVTNPPNSESLIEAIRHIPANEESLEVLKAVMEDDSKSIKARAMIPNMINNIDPSSFVDSALNILETKGISDEMIPHLISGLVGIKEENETQKKVINAKTQFLDKLEKAPKSLRKDIQRLQSDNNDKE